MSLKVMDNNLDSPCPRLCEGCACLTGLPSCALRTGGSSKPGV